MKRLVFIYFSLLVGFVSCKKDKVGLAQIEDQVTSECDCVPVPPFQAGTFDQYFVDSINHMKPLFSPNNDNIILYTDYAENGKVNMYTYDLLTGSRTLVFHGDVAPNLYDWSTTDWILFTRSSDHQIWKIRPNGDSLTQVTHGGQYFSPTCNLSGDKFIAYHGYYESSLPSEIWSLDGELIDSISWVHSNGSWKNEYYYGGYNAKHVVAIDPYTDQKVSDYTLPIDKTIQSFAWLSNNEAMLSTVDGIYIYNIYNHQVVSVRCSCSSKYYALGRSNFANTKLIFTKVTQRRVPGNIILYNNEVVTMDIDGTNEQLIHLPQ